MNTNENADAGLYQREEFIYDSLIADFHAKVIEIDDFMKDGEIFLYTRLEHYTNENDHAEIH